MKDTRRFERLELAPRDRLQIAVEGGGSADDEDTPRIRLQPECDIQSWAEYASYESPSCGPGARRPRFRSVSPTEHDRNAWSERVGVSP